MVKAKEYLQQIEKIDALIKNKEAERAGWYDMAVGMSSFQFGERVQSSRDLQKMGGAVAVYSDMDKEISEYMKEKAAIKQEIIKTIERLPVAEYDLLHKIYVQHLPLKEAAARMDKTYSWATTVHGAALKHVQRILDQKEE